MERFLAGGLVATQWDRRFRPDCGSFYHYLFGGGACHKAENYEQSQIFINPYKHTSASRAVEH
jgi:hypothetical protein